ncbi:MAG: phosphatase PAP2 family protein [Proteobacteria bacterium]|nr:phosphatase PAP2 family protein [Pseudomonadota bacterium]
MSFPKKLFYDWFGGNEAAFKAINGTASELTNTIAIVIGRLAKPEMFPYYIGVMATMALLDWGVRKLRQRGGAMHALIAWFGVICVVVAAYIIDMSVVQGAKIFFQMPRPYVVLAPEDVALLEYVQDRAEDYKSFPSSRVAFVTLMVISLWPVLSSATRKLALLALFSVAWAAIAVGMHFPADVVYAMILTLFITVPLRWFIYGLLLRFFNLKC